MRAIRVGFWHFISITQLINSSRYLKEINVYNRFFFSLQTYISDEDNAMEGHMILYPMDVSQTGEIRVLDGVECFPDTDAKVAGAKSAMLPMKLTT